MNLSYSNGLAVIIFFGFASTAYHYLSKKKKPLHTATKKQINDVIMFSKMPQSEMKKSKLSRTFLHPNMDRYVSYLNLSRYTLDICMYMITNSDIAHLIQKLHSKGVKIRLIVDADMAYATGSATKRLEMQGVELRWMKSTNLMHHKFCIINASPDIVDSSITPFIMIGSLNWTSQAFRGNWENVLVTSNPTIVNGLKEEFEKLWIQFKPIDK